MDACGEMKLPSLTLSAANNHMTDYVCRKFVYRNVIRLFVHETTELKHRDNFEYKTKIYNIFGRVLPEKLRLVASKKFPSI
jgi:hypothetical protein